MSKVRYLHNHQIDSEKWDACIQEAVPGLLYAYTWYLDIVCDEWDALVLNDYEAVMPLPFTRKYGIHFALQPPFAQQLGMYSRELLNSEMVHQFLDAIPNKFRWIKYQLNYRNNAGDMRMRTNYVLDLIQPYQDLKANYDKSLTRHLRKSEKSSCQILEGIDFPSLLDLIDFQNKEKNMGISSASRKKLEQLLHVTTSKGVLFTLGLYSPVNHLCSAALFLKDRNRIYYLLGASDEMGREYFGMGRIFDFVIRKYAGQAYTLDFEGSEIPGVAQFFLKFAPQNSPYPVFTRKGFGIFNGLMERKLGA